MTNRLQEIRDRWAKATPGPWDWGPLIRDMAGDYMIWRRRAKRRKRREFVATVGGLTQPICPPDAEILFQADADNAAAIACVPDDIAFLLAEVERLREQPFCECGACQTTRNILAGRCST